MVADYIIYVDGSIKHKNPSSVGSWAAVVIHGDTVQEYSGLVRMSYLGENQVTNNTTELEAVYNGLLVVPVREMNIDLYSDSQYALYSSQGKWRHTIKKAANGDWWVYKDNEKIANSHLIGSIRKLIHDQGHKVTFNHIKGHAGNVYNERVHQLAYDLSKQAVDILKMQTEVLNDYI